MDKENVGRQASVSATPAAWPVQLSSSSTGKPPQATPSNWTAELLERSASGSSEGCLDPKSLLNKLSDVVIRLESLSLEQQMLVERLVVYKGSTTGWSANPNSDMSDIASFRDLVEHNGEDVPSYRRDDAKHVKNMKDVQDVEVASPSRMEARTTIPGKTDALLSPSSINSFKSGSLVPMGTDRSAGSAPKDGITSGIMKGVKTIETTVRKRNWVFADKDQIKARLKMRMDETKDKHRKDKSLYKDTGFPGSLVAGAYKEYFEMLSLAIVCFNAMWIAIDLDVNDKTSPFESHPIFPIVDNLLCIYFLTEWSLKMGALKAKRTFYKDRWFILDSFLLILMILETWGLLLFYAVYPNRMPPRFLRSTQMLRTLRILRMTRISRAVKLFRYAPELLYLVHGMISGIRSVAYSMVLLVLLLYIFALLFRLISEGLVFGEKYFPNVQEAMLTLGIYAALLDGPSEIVQAMQDEEAYLNTCLFFLAIFMTALTLMNMLIGVLCDVVSTVSAAEREFADEQFIHSKLVRLFDVIDSDKDHCLSKDEFLRGLDDQDFVDALHELEVDTMTLLDCAEVLFQSDLTGREYKNTIDLNTFITCIVQLRGDNPARVRDVVEQRKLIHNQTTKTNDIIFQIAEKQQALEFNQLHHLRGLKALETQTYCNIKDLQLNVKRVDAKLDYLPNYLQEEARRTDVSLDGKTDAAAQEEVFEQLRTADLRLKRLEESMVDYDIGFMKGVEVGQAWEHEHNAASFRSKFHRNFVI